MVSNNILISFAVAFCFIQFSEALTCYKCDSSTKGCGDKDFDSSVARKMHCEPRPNEFSTDMVAKCKKATFQDSAGQMTQRDCIWVPRNSPNNNNQCYSGNNNYQQQGRQVVACEVCDGDLCNSANAKQIATFGFLAALVCIFMKFIN